MGCNFPGLHGIMVTSSVLGGWEIMEECSKLTEEERLQGCLSKDNWLFPTLPNLISKHHHGEIPSPVFFKLLSSHSGWDFP